MRSLLATIGSTSAPFDVKALAIVCFTAVIALGIGKLVFNAFFHPLAKFPGPRYAGASSLPFHAICFRGNALPWFQALHEQYGEVVRIRPNMLSYISPQAWKDIYGHRTGGRKANTKDPGPTRSRDFNGAPSLISELDDEKHGQTRRIFSNAFSDRALREQEPLLLRHVDKLVSNISRDIAKEPGRVFDAVKLYNFTTFDIMGDLAFGEPLGLLENSAYSKWVTMVFQGVKVIASMLFIFESPFWTALFHAMAPPSVRNTIREHNQHSIERVDRRLGAHHDKPDIWNLVLRQPEGRRLTVNQMYANADLFMLAGTETTATLLSGLTYHLLKNPDKMKKLVEEIRGFESADELTVDTLPRLRYLTACLEEGLRCYPPVPTMPYRVVAEGGNVICGDWVPGGTFLFVAQYPAFMSPRNFKDPESFIPERWLPGSGYDSDRKDVLQPFSVGPRNCIGKKYDTTAQDLLLVV
ncbi:Fum2 [Niveomyces insectorum RCEF 264]|uniref:Fum2 n=1 Tax=Niveomyces insectorum RCEF 264 TaxID=1081102 RepID=A0A168AC77_9HYPO|nr:Fum2 [Niveomyces insectorum RCEF 264]